MVEQEARNHGVERGAAERQSLGARPPRFDAGGTGEIDHRSRLVDSEHLGTPAAGGEGDDAGTGGHVENPGASRHAGGVEQRIGRPRVRAVMA